ncbi:hypothetical protein BYT27DRAFT_7181592 [Phlegmacium glaucopus]|nr:hypothetical protein BYT27DRAFT_7181592 [Phlegmacium glaucopus]
MTLRQLSDNQVIDISLEIKWKCLVLIGMKKTLQSDSDDIFKSFMSSYKKCVDSKEYGIYKDEAITSRAREVDDELLKAWNAARRLSSELRDIPEEQLTEERLDELVPHWRGHIEAMEESLYALNLRVHSSIDTAVVNLSSYFFWTTASELWTTASEHLGGIFYEWPLILDPLTIRATWEGIDWGPTPPGTSKLFIPHLIPPRLLICHLLLCADPRR